MKKIILFTVTLFLLVLVSCNSAKQEAVKYNDAIMTIVDRLTIEHELFFNQIDGHNIDSLKISHDLFCKKAKASLDSIKKIGPFEEEKNYKDVAEEYFTTINNLITKEGSQMVEIMSKDSTHITQLDLNRINELASKFDADYDYAYDKISAAQLKFSKKWKFDLIQTKK